MCLTFLKKGVILTYVKQTLHIEGDLLENKIKELRKLKGVTQDELAGAVEVTRQTIISLESGRYNASLLLAYKIARYFGEAIENVFIFEEDI